MKKILLIALLLLVGAIISQAQQTAPVQTRHLFESDVYVDSLWDSTDVGPASTEKTIEFLNDDNSQAMYYAFGNDTTAIDSVYGGTSIHHYVTVKAGKSDIIERAAGVKFVRTRAATTHLQRRIKTRQ